MYFYTINLRGDMMFNDATRALFLSVMAGLSTMIGALVICFSNRKNEKLVSISLAFAGGVMISVSFTDLLPNSLDYFSSSTNHQIGTLLMVSSLILGVLFASLLDRFVPHEEETTTHEKKHENLFRVGIVSMLAIAIHNFPEGIATFMAGYESSALGTTIALAIAFHNIPEGITVALPVYIASGSRKKAFYYTFISGISEPIGAFLAFLVLQPFINGITLGLMFGLISGIMLYIAIEELLPSSKDYGYPRLALYATFAGICLMPLTTII